MGSNQWTVVIREKNGVSVDCAPRYIRGRQEKFGVRKAGYVGKRIERLARMGGGEHGDRIAWHNQVVKCFAVNGRILGLNGRWGGLNGSCSENVPSVPRFPPGFPVSKYQ